MRENLQTLLYSAVMGLVCAALLTGAGLITEPRAKANRRADKVRHVLNVLEVPVEEDASAEELLRVFQEKVRKEEGEEYDYYFYAGEQAGGRPEAVAVDFSGQGLWGPIKGLLALESDMRTIRGVSFYKQHETPGLGGEIASEWFRRQFEGKRVIGPDGEPGVRINPPSREPAPNEVDAITGATMTCQKVEKMLNRTIADITEED